MSRCRYIRSVEGRPTDEKQLIVRAREGDADAYGALVKRYEGIALRTAYVVSGSSGDAEDAAQEAFVKAFYALDRFRVDEPFRPWLLKIVANEARNRTRAAGRRVGLSLKLERSGPSGGAAPSPEATALQNDERLTLLDAMRGLREGDREVLAYRYFLDLSEKEIAELLGCRPGTVKSRLSRALVRLRERFPSEDPIEGGAL
jgi:RNA polymerase sigma-70 factor (ECF subfamily)